MLRHMIFINKGFRTIDFMPDYLSITGGANIWIYTFPKDINAMWNANSSVQDLNPVRRAHLPRR